MNNEIDKSMDRLNAAETIRRLIIREIAQQGGE